ncbi:MAG: HAD hydrolase-like protein [Pseudomonadota bacterium]|nr:HAD hydrolase-like protein [Pseudomonadota bacterium]
MDVAIFDLDGTLVDTAPDIIDALNRTLSDMGLAPLDDETGRSFIGGGARKLVSRALTASNVTREPEINVDDAYSRFIIYYTEKCADRSTLYPDVIETLEMLAEEEIAMGVCTNKPQALSLDVLSAFGLKKFFRAVVGGDVLPEQKPAARHLLETVGRTATACRCAAMIGDSSTDVAAARNANIPVVVVNYGYTTIAPADLGADAVISNLRELPSLIPTFWKSA